MADGQEALALEALVKGVQVGQRVYVTNHDYLNGSGACTVESRPDGKVVFRLDKPERSQGRTFTTSWLDWPEEGDDYEVDLSRRILRTYRRSYGSRVIALTVSFGEAGTDSFRFCRECRGCVAYSAHTAH